jgi:hypothetical protein
MVVLEHWPVEQFVVIWLYWAFLLLLLGKFKKVLETNMYQIFFLLFLGSNTAPSVCYHLTSRPIFLFLEPSFFCCYGTEHNAFCTLLWNTDQITLSFHHLFYYFYHVTFFVLQNVYACSRTLDSFAWFSQFIILSFFITFGRSLVCCIWGTTGCIFVC